MRARRVMILAGGTGGHIYPALAVADRLRAQGVSLCWIGSRNGMEGRVVPRHDIPLHEIMIEGLRGRGLRRWLLAPWFVLVATLQSMLAMRRARPGVVLGMGGFVSGPGGLAAWLCRRPLVIHEQNAVPGLTNRLLRRIATRVLEAYPGTFDARAHAVATGNPVRAEIAAVPAPATRLAGRGGLRVLVIGGSRGARRLNEVVPAALAVLDTPALEAWHQTGAADLEATRAAYAATRVPARIDPFIHDMAAAYAWADIVVCRAGAMTVAELAAAGVAAVLVPFPHAVDDHQTAHARYLTQPGAAHLVAEADLTPAGLAEILAAFARDRAALLSMAQAARALGRADAADRVAAHCLEVLGVSA